jgi:RHH-type rel operon transcriptional repressor/antitoxin RelB
MIGVRFDKKTEKRLNHIAKATHRTVSYYVRQAVQRYLDEEEDVLIALSRIEDKPDELLTTEQLWKRLGWTKDLVK